MDFLIIITQNLMHLKYTINILQIKKIKKINKNIFISHILKLK